MSKGSKADRVLDELRGWTKRVVAGQAESACFLQLFSPDMREHPEDDPIPIMQLGYAMVLDKPILIVAVEGTAVPKNIRRAATAVEFYPAGDMDAMKTATLRALRAGGIDVKQ